MMVMTAKVNVKKILIGLIAAAAVILLLILVLLIVIAVVGLLCYSFMNPKDEVMITLCDYILNRL